MSWLRIPRGASVGALLWGAIAGQGMLAGGAEAAPGTVLVYSALDERVTAEIVRAFEARSGVDAEVVAVAAAGTLAARVAAEKASPKADVFVGGAVDFHEPLAAAGLLLPYESPVFADSQIDRAFVDPEGRWYGWYLSTLSIVANHTRFRKVRPPRDLALPKTWDDLLAPAYKGHFTMPSPVTTGAGYVFVASQVFRLGEENAFRYLKRLAANAAQITPTVPLAAQLVARGEVALAVNWSHEALALVRRDAPLKVIFPADLGFEIGGVSIVKDGPNPEGARRLVDFLLTKAAQELGARVYLRHPTRLDAAPVSGVPALSSLKLVNYDRVWAAENRTRLQEWWREEVEE